MILWSYRYDSTELPVRFYGANGLILRRDRYDSTGATGKVLENTCFLFSR
jgi:hypothetical protein